MRVIIAGSRHFTSPDVRSCIDHAAHAILEIPENWEGVTAILSGGADGVDQYGELLAKEHGIPLEQYIPGEGALPSWEEFGKMAGPFRNNYMAERADALILVWDGESPGSASMKSCAKKNGLAVAEVIWEDESDLTDEKRTQLQEALEARALDPNLTDEEREHAHGAAEALKNDLQP